MSRDLKRPIDDNELASAWYAAAIRAAVIAALFCMLVGGILVHNHFRLIETDTRKSTELTALKTKLRKHPQDEQLKTTIRKRDQQLRSEYLRRLTVAREGGWVLLWGVAVFLVAAPAAIKLRKPLHLPESETATIDDVKLATSYSKRSVMVFGLLALGSFGVLAAISKPDLTKSYVLAIQKAGSNIVAKPNAVSSAPVQAQTQPAQAPLANSAPPVVPGAINPGPLPPLNPLPLGVAGITSGQSTTSGTKPSAAQKLETVAFDSNDYYPGDDEIDINWPVFRGPRGSAVVSTGNYPTKWNGSKKDGILWKSRVPLPGENSPVVWGDRVFISGATSTKRGIFCFDAKSGKLLWAHDVKSTVKSPDVMADTGYAAPTMAVDGKRAFAIFANGDLVCCDFDGKELWSRNLGVPESQYGHASSLAMFCSLLLVQYDQGSSGKDGKSAIFAFQGGTGKLVWYAKRTVPNSWSTPIVVNTGERDEVITCANPWVISYDPMTGNEIWRVGCLGGDVAPSPAYYDGLIFATNVDTCLAAIKPGGEGDVTKSHILWKANEYLPSITSPVSNGELVFVVSSEGMLTCYDAKTGKKAWDHDLQVMCNASPIVVGKLLYLLDAEGNMHIIQAGRSFREESTASLGEKTSATSAFVGGKIYIRGKENLYCVGDK